MNKKSKISIKDIAQNNEISEFEATTCLERALSKIIQKEVFFNDKEGFSYFNDVSSNIIPVRITNKVLSEIPKAFEHEMIKIKNEKLKSIFYLGQENSVLMCKITRNYLDYYEATSVNGGFVGRLYLDQMINSKERLLPDSVIDLKIKSLIKHKRVVQCVFTQLDYSIYERYIYKIFEKDSIKRLKIDFTKKNIIITFHTLKKEQVDYQIKRLSLLIDGFNIIIKENK